MKVILSHDVDHIHGLEHWKDRYWPGVWYRGLKSLVRRDISLSTCLRRATPWQRLERIKEVLEMDLSVGAKPTFFFGMSKGLRLSYGRQSAYPFMQYLLERDVPVGIHGMAYDDQKKMEKEYETFQQLAGIPPVGIRNHYLRKSEDTLSHMADIGYRFDSTTYALKPPFKVNGMWEFPISLMDVSLGIDTTLEFKKQVSLQIYSEAIAADLPYFVLNFHDAYYSDSYPSLKKWYQWCLTYLSKRHTYISYQEAINELNG